MIQKYELIMSESQQYPAGTIVYDLSGTDYGCANDDTRHTGVEHISVTLKPDGGYPGFSVPRHKLRLQQPNQ